MSLARERRRRLFLAHLINDDQQRGEGDVLRVQPPDPVSPGGPGVAGGQWRGRHAEGPGGPGHHQGPARQGTQVSPAFSQSVTSSNS